MTFFGRGCKEGEIELAYFVHRENFLISNTAALKWRITFGVNVSLVCPVQGMGH
jgi:hypothetical protein